MGTFVIEVEITGRSNIKYHRLVEVDASNEAEAMIVARDEAYDMLPDAISVEPLYITEQLA